MPYELAVNLIFSHVQSLKISQVGKHAFCYKRDSVRSQISAKEHRKEMSDIFAE